MASGKHLLEAYSAGVKGKLSSFFLPWGDGRGIRTVQMARLRTCGDGWITEIRCKIFLTDISVCKIYPLLSLHVM